jgi:hypothetical protein
MKHKKREPHCWQCGVEMGMKEERLGLGYCYDCADHKVGNSQERNAENMQAIREAE